LTYILVAVLGAVLAAGLLLALTARGLATHAARFRG